MSWGGREGGCARGRPGKGWPREITISHGHKARPLVTATQSESATVSESCGNSQGLRRATHIILYIIYAHCIAYYVAYTHITLYII